MKTGSQNNNNTNHDYSYQSNDLLIAGSLRMTTAAVLREDAVYRKRQLIQANAIKMFESELRDAADFDRKNHEVDVLNQILKDA